MIKDHGNSNLMDPFYTSEVIFESSVCIKSVYSLNKI